MNFEQIKEINNSSAMPTYGRYELAIASGREGNPAPQPEKAK